MRRTTPHQVWLRNDCPSCLLNKRTERPSADKWWCRPLHGSVVNNGCKHSVTESPNEDETSRQKHRKKGPVMRAWISARHYTSSHIAKRTARAVVLTVEKPHHGRGALLPAVEPRPPSTLPRTFRFRQLRNLHHPLHTTLASSTSDASISHNPCLPCP